MSARHWLCRRQQDGVVCATRNPATKQKCVTCGAARPKRRQPAHRAILSEMPYEAWVARYGEFCGICGRAPTARRRLDRDHAHNGSAAGAPRGLLCARCNRALPSWCTPEWLRAAADYLDRANRSEAA